MQPNQKTDQYLHAKLPIGKDEKILGVFRHHWFAYASVWIVAAIVVLAVAAISIGIVVGSDAASTIGQHHTEIFAAAAFFCVIVVLFAAIPAWLKSQEQVVLTEEALLQLLQPSLFASKVSQLNLDHVSDVSVRQDFFGSMFGYGKITIETPGEQDDYEFTMLPDPHNTAKQIIDAHENFSAALQGGRMQSTLGAPQAPQLDAQQFQEFLQFQQAERTMAAQQQAAAPATNTDAAPQIPTQPQPAAQPLAQDQPSQTAPPQGDAQQSSPTAPPAPSAPNEQAEPEQSRQ